MTVGQKTRWAYSTMLPSRQRTYPCGKVCPLYPHMESACPIEKACVNCMHGSTERVTDLSLVFLFGLTDGGDSDGHQGRQYEADERTHRCASDRQHELHCNAPAYCVSHDIISLSWLFNNTDNLWLWNAFKDIFYTRNLEENYYLLIALKTLMHRSTEAEPWPSLHECNAQKLIQLKNH